MASVVSLLCSYPLWAGERAILRVQASTKFIPTIADIKPVLDEYVRLPKYAAQFDREAEEQLLRIGAPVERKPSLDELKARHGENWGITDPTRRDKPQNDPEATLRAEFGDAAFEALPDAKPRSDMLQPLAVPVQEAAE